MAAWKHLKETVQFPFFIFSWTMQMLHSLKIKYFLKKSGLKKNGNQIKALSDVYCIF